MAKTHRPTCVGRGVGGVCHKPGDKEKRRKGEKERRRKGEKGELLGADYTAAGV